MGFSASLVRDCGREFFSCSIPIVYSIEDVVYTILLDDDLLCEFCRASGLNDRTDNSNCIKKLKSVHAVVIVTVLEPPLSMSKHLIILPKTFSPLHIVDVDVGGVDGV